jgi:hypothetical protein
LLVYADFLPSQEGVGGAVFTTRMLSFFSPRVLCEGISMKIACLTIILASLFTLALSASALDVPRTPQHPVTNSYHGTAVVDSYLWLENFEDPAVKKWNEAQNRITRTYLDKLPARAQVAERLKKLYAATSPNYSGLQYRHGIIFAMKFQPPAQQPWLVTLKSLDDLASERVVLDLNKLNPKGTTAMDWVVPSHDGKKIAVSLSETAARTERFLFMMSKPANHWRTKFRACNIPPAAAASRGTPTTPAFTTRDIRMKASARRTT